MVRSSDTVYKVVYSLSEQTAISRLTSKLASVSTPLQFVITPVDFPMFSTVCIYKYKMVKFGPLARSDAIKCLRALVEGIMKAISELHNLGFSHNDIRLPNVCFNDSYEPVLIDIEGVGQLIIFTQCL